jgi:hypothetical protein
LIRFYRFMLLFYIIGQRIKGHRSKSQILSEDLLPHKIFEDLALNDTCVAPTTEVRTTSNIFIVGMKMEWFLVASSHQETRERTIYGSTFMKRRARNGRTGTRM